MEIEIAYADAAKQTTLKLNVAAGSTIAQAIVASKILEIAAIITALEDLNVGIFGKPRDLQHILAAGDRIEIYRQLHVDPKTARHNRAKQQQIAKRKQIMLAKIAKKAAKNN